MVILVTNKTKFSELKKVILSRPWSLGDSDAASYAGYLIGAMDELVSFTKILRWPSTTKNYNNTFYVNGEGFVDVFHLEFENPEVKEKVRKVREKSVFFDIFTTLLIFGFLGLLLVLGWEMLIYFLKEMK